MSTQFIHEAVQSRLRGRNRWPGDTPCLGRPGHHDALVFGLSGSPGTSGVASERRCDIDDGDADRGVNALVFHQGAQFTIGDAGVLARDDVPVRDLRSPCRFLLPAGSGILTGGPSGAVIEALSGAPVCRYRSPLTSGATFLRDGLLHAVIGTDSGDGLVLRLRADGRFALVATLPLHAEGVLGLAADAEHIFSAGADGSVRLTRIADVRIAWVRPQTQADAVTGCAAWAQGFVGVARDRLLKLWRGDGTEEAYRVPLPRPITCVAVCPDSHVVAAGSQAGQVAFFDLASRSWLRSARLPVKAVSTVAAVPSQPRVFTVAGRDGSVHTLRVR